MCVLGKYGQQRMKGATVALLCLIEKRSGLSPAQLEAKFGLGLRDMFDQETGQEWLRYRHMEGTYSKSGQALSIAKLFDVATLAHELGYVTEDELLPLGLVDLASADALGARLDSERAALKLFRRGLMNLAHGKLPLPPGGSKGGRPRPPRCASEAAVTYQEWTAKIQELGCEVFEDRAEIEEQERTLRDQAQQEGRLVTAVDYDGLPDWIRPFDPVRPNGGALNRLRIRFSFGQLDQPWLPDDKRLPGLPQPSFDIWPATDEEIDLFFESFQENIDQASRKSTADN